MTEHIDSTIDVLLPDSTDELRLQRFSPVGSYDAEQQEVNMTFSVQDLLAASVRKIDAETGKKKSPAVMFCLPLETQVIEYIANGNVYEIRLGLGRQNVGAYMTIQPRKIGQVSRRHLA